MVLVDFTVAERWRIFGEFSVASAAQRAPTARQTPVAKEPASARSEGIDPRESAARSRAEASLMQRLL